MRESGLEQRARAVRATAAAGDLVAVTSAGGALGDAIQAAPLPEALVSAITAAYGRLCDGAGTADVPVAVRSSGVAEDLEGASFAGQYDTYLWVIGIDAVLDHVRRCWTGLFGPQVLTYHPRRRGGAARSRHGRRRAAAWCGRGRPASCSRSTPSRGDRSKIVIESCLGSRRGRRQRRRHARPLPRRQGHARDPRPRRSARRRASTASTTASRRASGCRSPTSARSAARSPTTTSRALADSRKRDRAPPRRAAGPRVGDRPRRHAARAAGRGPRRSGAAQGRDRRGRRRERGRPRPRHVRRPAVV